MINTKTIGYVLTKTPKKWGGVFLKYSKSGGVSFISLKTTKKQGFNVGEVIHVK